VRRVEAREVVREDGADDGALLEVDVVTEHALRGVDVCARLDVERRPRHERTRGRRRAGTDEPAVGGDVLVDRDAPTPEDQELRERRRRRDRLLRDGDVRRRALGPLLPAGVLVAPAPGPEEREGARQPGAGERWRTPCTPPLGAFDNGVL
jgi:hypothetical protein